MLKGATKIRLPSRSTMGIQHANGIHEDMDTDARHMQWLLQANTGRQEIKSLRGVSRAKVESAPRRERGSRGHMSILVAKREITNFSRGSWLVSPREELLVAKCLLSSKYLLGGGGSK